MANNVTNIIHFLGDEKQIVALRAAVQHDEYDTRAMYGTNNWLDWSIANWGTKWNAFRFDDDLDDHAPGRIVFVTANGALHPVLKKLSEMYPDIIMRHQWADENVGYNCGARTYKGGRLIDEYIPDYGTRAVDFACGVMGTTPADHYLRLSEDGTEYICAEEDAEIGIEERMCL